MSLSKDVSLNSYVHQTESKMKENTVYIHLKLHIIPLLQCFGGKGVGGLIFRFFKTTELLYENK